MGWLEEVELVRILIQQILILEHIDVGYQDNVIIENFEKVPPLM